MPGNPQPRYEHQVELQVERREIGARQQEGFCGASDPPPLPRRQRRCRRVEFVSRLDLDDREHAAAPRQDVDLARGATPAAGEDTPAPQPQMPQAQPFGEPPAALRKLPPMHGRLPCRSHSSPSRIAKARRYSSPRGIPVSAASFAAASRTPSSASAVRRRLSTSAWSGCGVRADRRRPPPRRAAARRGGNGPQDRSVARVVPPRATWSARARPRPPGCRAPLPCRRSIRRAVEWSHKTPAWPRPRPSAPARAAAPLAAVAESRRTRRRPETGPIGSARSPPRLDPEWR